MIAATLFLLAAYLYWFAPGAEIPLEPATLVDVSRVRELRPRRSTLEDPPRVVVGGFSHRCNDCHRLFQSAPETPDRLMQHRHIQFQHGLNDRCFNCHEREDRERLVLRDGSTISFAEVPVLCAGCHGTTYRDWQQGMHGKTLGSWNPASGAMERLVCTECHNPHAPAYPDYVPLPGPDTLRMGHPVTAHGSEPGRPLSPPWAGPTDSSGSHGKEGHP